MRLEINEYIWFSFFSLVCAVVREFRPAPDRPRRCSASASAAVGGGRLADGRGDPAAISRTRSRLGAVGLGGLLGSRRLLPQGNPVLGSAAGDGVPLDVRGRRTAGAAGVLHPPLRHRAGDRCRGRAQQAAERRSSGALQEIFSGPILKTTILASPMATGCQGGYCAITFWVAQFLTQGAASCRSSARPAISRR